MSLKEEMKVVGLISRNLEKLPTKEAQKRVVDMVSAHLDEIHPREEGEL